MKQLILYGAGGHAKVLLDIALKSNFSVIGIHHDQARAGEWFTSIPVLGESEFREQVEQAATAVIVAVGDNWTRASIVQKLISTYPAIRFATLIHPQAVIANQVAIGEGSVVMAGAVVNAAANIGKHVIVNTNSVVEHDCQLADYSSLGPACALGGNVMIGEYSNLGMSSTVIHNITIGAHAVIGAGSTVLAPIADLTVAYGTPAKPQRIRQMGEPYL